MAKKNLLAANLKRPSLKRTMRVSEDKMDEVVRKVADNPPPPKERAKKTSAPASKTPPAPAAAPSSKGEGSKGERGEGSKGERSKGEGEKGRGAARRPAGNKASSAKSVHPAEGTKRLTLDIPHSLHKELKLLSIHQEISMKDYIISVVERSLRK
jgi:hypothetical protein